TLQAFRADVQAELKEGGTSSVTTRLKPQAVLVVGEIAISMVLLVGAGLAFHSTKKALSADPGFDPARIWGFRVVMPPAEFPNGMDVRAFSKRIQAGLYALPGVQEVSVTLGGLPKPAAVDENYLRLMGIRLLRGRFVGGEDSRASRLTIVIDDSLARAR